MEKIDAFDMVSCTFCVREAEKFEAAKRDEICDRKSLEIAFSGIIHDHDSRNENSPAISISAVKCAGNEKCELHRSSVLIQLNGI